MAQLQTQGEVGEKEDDKTTKESEDANAEETPEQEELRNAALAKLNEMAGKEGLGSQQMFQGISGDKIDDKYGFE